ncbi:NAD(P)/FAD-dependent oxidoreductase [Aurantiacibacter gangjinensis]|uniref:Membrane protein n=1 Tax=Aurantiacibacter gangjinensis TaxID=502682 RepID=A0A0G9MRC6_9SPHN|nr:NAD(P)/FAD-dependent oxidoreductase [Aurantiacibacter gangjinensis]APE29236.1 NAD(FAD)-utilizing dehydrogenase [Aurantiacibacter gangjinensis]KLE33291.1 membrane protein [Aurantiacibacter gangjinensis]
MSDTFDAIILGGGAAGLFCAAEAAKRGRDVCVLERAGAVGKKILISGGGRCNFTNIGAGPENYLSANPHFAKSALARYTARDFLDLVEKHGIAWHEKTLGQLFCDGSAKQIVQMLLDECDAAPGAVDIRCNQEIGDVSRAGDSFTVTTQHGNITAPKLVIATGGPSIPKMGASDFAYRLARQFGLKVVEPRPALVPLTLGGEDVLFRELSGVAAPVEASAAKGRFREAALFTHRGLSGPAILQASSYWTPGEPVTVNFLPDLPADWLLDAKRDRPRITMKAALREHLPDRLADTLSERLGVSTELGNAPDKALRAAQEKLARWTFRPNGTEGFAKAEVTIGGIATGELSSQTMEAKNVPGLFAIGEAVDVTGWLGGYNFQWAWASGHAAAQAL